MTPTKALVGKGILQKGERPIGEVSYNVQTHPNGQAALIRLEPKPEAEEDDLLHLRLEDGRVLNCRVIDDSPYCAVVGDGPITERRETVRLR